MKSTAGTSTKGSFPSRIIGLGSSAGGLNPLMEVVKRLSAKPNWTVVVLQHSDPKRKSQLDQILAPLSKLKVEIIKDRQTIRAKRIYVAPAGKLVTVNGSQFRLGPLKPHGHVIDAFFNSLAEEKEDQAVGIILSGSNSDGALGLNAIQRKGGLTIAQEPGTAQFSEMPENAIRLNAARYVLAPKEIAPLLERLSQWPQVPERDESLYFSRVLRVLKIQTGIDFTHYKPATLQRRMLRRVDLLKVGSIEEYLKILESNTAEADRLYRDFLINVTSFFRDPESFESLKTQVFPPIAESLLPNQPIRVWVPGCSTGEEAYSIAISLHAYLLERKIKAPIQIFATDIDDEALAWARGGQYLPSSVESMPTNLLRRYFKKTKTGYNICKEIRDLCVFAKQNVVKDPPFSRLDLISCRNLFIYIKPTLQQKVLSLFHYSLKPTGFLMLGANESVGAASGGLFSVVDKKYKIYSRRIAENQKLDFLFAEPGNFTPAALTEGVLPAHFPTTVDLQKESDAAILAHLAPPGVVISEKFDILHFRGVTSPFLESPEGAANLNLLKMVRKGLSVEIHTLVHRAKRDNEPVRKAAVAFYLNGKARLVDIEVIPFKPFSISNRYFLVLFEGDRPLRAAKSTALAKEPAELQRLQQELFAAKEYLQSTIEQHESINEELKTANEEILSSNEELQSTNEELETTKEELQASNEELTTLNDELQVRNLNLNQVNADLENLLVSVNLPVIILGKELSVRRYTPPAEKQFNLMPADIGRPLNDLRLGLMLGAEELHRIVGEVIASGKPRENDSQDRGGKWYCIRVHPYLTSDGHIDGAVVVFIDIDQIKRNEDRLRLSEEQNRLLVEAVKDYAIFMLDTEGRVNSWNEGAAHIKGYKAAEIIGKHFSIFYPPEAVARRHPEFELDQARKNGRFEEEGWRVRKDGSRFFAKVVITAVFDQNSRLRGYSKVTCDITEKRAAELALRESEEKFRAVAQSARDALISIDQKGAIIFWNRGATELFGYSESEALQRNVAILAPQRLHGEYFALLKDISQSKAGQLVGKSLELQGLKLDGAEFPAEITFSSWERNSQTFYTAIVRDATERHWIQRLQNIRLQVADLLVGRPEVGDAVRQILQTVCEGMGWRVGGFWRLKRERQLLEFHSGFSLQSDLLKQYVAMSETLSLSKGQGLPGRTWDSEPQWLKFVENDPRPLRVELIRQIGMQSCVTFPVGTGDEFFGVMEFFSEAIAEPDVRLLRLMGEIGHLLNQYFRRKEAEAQLVDLNRELEGRVVSRTRDLARAVDRERFLSSVSKELASSLDYQLVLKKLAQLLVPDFADWCWVHILDDGGPLKLVAIGTEDKRVEEFRQYNAKFPIRLKDEVGPANVVRKGESEFWPVIPDTFIEEFGKVPDHVAFLLSLDLQSLICVPLKARGKILGSLTLAYSSSRRTYSSSDLEFIEELASRIAVAVDNVQLLNQAQTSSKAKDEFLATLSHELRTPLNVIQGWINILRTEKLDEANFNQAIDTLDRNTKLQIRLISDLLDISRIVSGKLTLESQPVELSHILKETVDSVMLRTQEKGIELVSHLSPEPLYVLGDLSHLQRMVLNLLTNAIKFTPAKGKIVVESTANGKEAVIIVRDTGQGIDPQFIPFIFESFKQEDSTTTRAHEGLGLGLAIARHIVELHGGQIGVKSDGRGKGAEFTVRLPLTDKTILSERTAEPKSAPSTQSLENLKILLVDDSPDILILVSRLLHRRGAKVLATSSAPQAFEEFLSQRPDLILSDISMPGEDGYSLIRRVRSLPGQMGGNTPAVALTAYAREEEKQQSLEAGFDAHLSKPIEDMALVASVLRVLERK